MNRKPRSHRCVEVFADPLRERATAVIVAHNQHNGNLIPSNDDTAKSPNG